MVSSLKSKFKKIYRFVILYGLERTLVKTASRYSNLKLKYFLFRKFIFQKDRCISLIGCGQFGFATISYFLLKNQGQRFLDCYDIDENRAQFTSKFYNYSVQPDVNNLFSNSRCKLIYISSNHYSHTSYAIQALRNNKDIYIEKPISVTKEQFALLKTEIKKSTNRVFVGYNRPYSQAIREISLMIQNTKKPISLSCFISGHVIDADHWYRIPREGTRICGNVGHWIDLMIHLMNKRGEIPKCYEVIITNANPSEIDDNIVISIRTELFDIVSIFITARTEPFEGINETINLQCGTIIAKIDDFKRVIIWDGEKKYIKKYSEKDVGHQLAINQPFLPEKEIRQWNEIEVSTELMLEISDMVRQHLTHKKINIK